MNTDQKIVVLGALLHDIGKFSQRAGGKKSENDFLQPTKKGNYSHYHVLYTDAFIEDPGFPLPLDLKPRGNEDIRSTLALKAADHHNPDENDLVEMCITMGDRLSSGMDRAKMNEQEEKDRNFFKRARINCILDEVEIERHKTKGKWFYRLAELRPDDTIFPVEGSEIGKDESYEDLFQSFMQETKKLQQLEYRHYVSWLLNMLERFTWSIPSSTYKNVPDIPLFDHLKTTAAIAEALYLYHKEKGGVPRIGDKEKKFILLLGDLSGIQRFIFSANISSGRGVTRLFRARSFFLQALTRSVVLSVQHRLDMSETSLILDAGGKFMMLLPNLDRTLKVLSEIEKELDEYFFENFNAELSLSIDYSTKASHEDLNLENFSRIYDSSNQMLELSKLTQFNRLLRKKGPLIDKEYGKFSEEGLCQVCAKHPEDEECTKAFNRDSQTNIRICSQCFNLIDKIGRRLPDARYIVYSEDNNNQGICLFDAISIELKRDAPIINKGTLYVQGLDDDAGYGRGMVAGFMPRIHAKDLEDEDFKKRARKEFEPEKSGLSEDELINMPITFSLMAYKASHKSSENKMAGRELLGLLKADVDNLGMVFSMGLKQRFSISRLSYLSRMMNFFFSRYLVTMIKDMYPSTYVVFAGGDDLFLIGPWIQENKNNGDSRDCGVISLAFDIRDKFKRFVAGNEDMSLSCGLEVVKPRLPLRRSATSVEEALNSSKHYEAKDAITLFTHTLPWQDMQEHVFLGDKLAKLAEDEESKVSTAFLYRLLEYVKRANNYKSARETGKNIKPRDALYQSAIHYDVGRNIAKVEHGVCINEDEVNDILSILPAEGRSRYDLGGLLVAINYAVNKTRKVS